MKKFWTTVLLLFGILFLGGCVATGQNKEELSVVYESAGTEQEDEYQDMVLYTFRSDELLQNHYEKHGKEMGFQSAQEYVDAANKVICHPDVLHKIEKEDGDDVYYLEETNEFVVVSQDDYIRTYFCPDSGIAYFNRQ